MSLYDDKITTLNTALSALGWIENVYGITHEGIDDKGTFPELNGTQRIYPSGKSISFFTIEKSFDGIDEDFDYTASLGLVVWADLTKVDTSKQYNYTSDLLKDVVNVLRENSCNDIVINFDDPFKGFSDLQKENYQNIALPYTAFKIYFNCVLLIGV